MILRMKEMNNLGYTVITNIDIESSDRGLDDLLSSLGVKDINEITIDSPCVVSEIKAITNYRIKKELPELTGGKWMLFLSSNDIGWVFLSVGYFEFNSVTEITKCRVTHDDGTKGYVFLQETSAEKIENFVYLDANDEPFKGVVEHSDSFVSFQMRKHFKDSK